VVETIKRQVESAKVARGEQPRELTARELEEIKKFGQAE